MPTIEPILMHALPMMLVITRITGIFMFTPMLASTSIPRNFKALLAFMFGVAIYPFVPHDTMPASLTIAQLVPLMFTELLIGAAIGLIAGIPLIALQMGGYIMGYQMGLSLAESFNPELDTNASVVGQLLFYLSVFIYIGMGGFEIIFVILADSFFAIDVGAFGAGDAPLALLLGVLSSGFELALRVASPILGVISMLLIAMGFIMKTMPQINIMSIGFAAQILTGLTFLLLVIGVIGTVVGQEMVAVLELLHEWVWSFAAVTAKGTTHG